MNAGIYQIRNLVNDKRYVGSAMDVHQRLAVHLRRLRRNDHHSQKLQAAWNKYGADCFVMELIESVEKTSDLLAAEQRWIDHHAAFELGYNMRSQASSQLGYKMREDSKQRIKAALTGRRQPPEAVELTRQAHLGARRSVDARNRMSEAQKARIHPAGGAQKLADHLRALAAANAGRPRPDDVRQRISESSKGKTITAEQREKLRAAATGKKQSSETVALRIANMVATKAAKRAQRENQAQA